MTFQGAVFREQGVTFAVVIVKKHVIDSGSAEAGRAIAAFQPVFPGLPVVLMAQDYQGTPTYYGRRDIARFLAGVPLGAIPWKQYTV
jgi:hypothetical protein